MKLLLIVLLILFQLPENAAVAGGTQQRASAEQSLVLSTQIVSQRHCAGAANMDTLQMRIRLRYENAGRGKLILYRGKNLFYQTRVRPVVHEAGAKGYEVVVLNARFNDAQAEVVDRAAPGGPFVVLSPGGVYETEVVVGVGISVGGGERINNTVIAGEHTLQVVASTWYESRALADNLRQRWQRSGYLWSEPVASTPLRFAVEKNRPVVNCQ